MGFNTIEDILDWDLPPAAKVVLIALAHRHNDRSGKCYPGLDDIAKMTCLGRRTVIRQIKFLEGVGAVVVVRKSGVPNHYQPVPHVVTGDKMAPVTNGGVHPCQPVPNQCQSLAPEEKNRKKDKSAAPSPWRGEASRLLERVTKSHRPAFEDLEFLKDAAQGNELAWRRFQGSTEGMTKKFRKAEAS
jgi:hypothetical protein